MRFHRLPPDNLSRIARDRRPGGGDYATAISQALAAEMVVSTLGDMDRSAGPAGGQRCPGPPQRHRFILRVRQQQGDAPGRPASAGPHRRARRP